jgi:hypothetical protein
VDKADPEGRAALDNRAEMAAMDATLVVKVRMAAMPAPVAMAAPAEMAGKVAMG